MIAGLFQLLSTVGLMSGIGVGLGAGYMSGSGINHFPKPLTAKEEAQYIEQWEQGDEEARNALIEHNLRLVAHIAKRYANNGHDMDDLISIGIFGLTKAVMTYNTGKDIKLVTYASKCIDNEILMYLRSIKKMAGDVSLQDSIGKDKDGNDMSLIDLLTSGEESVEDTVWLKTRAEQAYASIEKVLDGREKKIIYMRYGLNGGKEYTQREIASAMGISRSYVSRIEKKALEKLRRIMS